MLIGNFIVPNFPAEVRDKMDFVRFPTMKPSVGQFEDAPMNSLHIPARAANKEAAKQFLSFVLRAQTQEEIAKALLLIPVHADAAVADDRFLKKGRALLNDADALAQYFDRDTNEGLATIAMKGFQEFMVKPERLDAILDDIERARLRIYER
jgi:multiple sugar transport system substrate-binding protein